MCCQGSGAPCCRGAERQSPTPVPVNPASADSHAQPAFLAAHLVVGTATQAVPARLLRASLAPASGPVPLFLTSCAFRC